MGDNSPALLENQYQQGDQPFYLGRHRAGNSREFVPQDKLTRQHFHSGLELGGVVGGTGRLVLDGKEFPLGAGTIFFLDPMLPHESYGEALDLVVAHLTRESVVDAHVDKGDLRLLGPFTGVRGGLAPVVGDMRDDVAKLVTAVGEYERRTPSGKQRAFLMVLEVVESLCDRAERDSVGANPRSTEKDRLASRILQFIYENYARDIGMDEIAAFTGMSVSTIAHLFKDYTGQSPIGFRNQVRITHALEMIKMTNETMSSIALACGFNNTSQFYRMFKKFAGVVPADLRTREPLVPR